MGPRRTDDGRLVRRVLDAAYAAREGTRREDGQELPLGDKARRTRDLLLETAYTVFSEDGYQRTSVGEIADRTGVSLGTFYQYFRDRKDVLATIVYIAVLDYVRENRRTWDPAQGRRGLRSIIAPFVEVYADSAPFQAMWEEVTHVDEDMAALRRDLSTLFTRGIERGLVHGARHGLVRDDLDVAGAARALAAMVDRYCYLVYAFDPPAGGPPPVAETVDLLTELWAGAIGLAEPETGSKGHASPPEESGATASSR